MSSQIRHRRLVATGIVIGAVIVLAVLIALRPRPQRLKPQAPAPLVTIETVTSDQPPVAVTGWGTVVPRRTISLVPQVAGEVTAVSPNLRAGSFFAAGEVLLRIDDTDYVLAAHQARSEVAQAESNLATAEEEARVAREEWERTRSDALEGSELRSSEPNPLVYREPQLRLAEAGLEAARAALAQAELNLERCTLEAPFDGRVLSESVDVGQFVRSGEVLAQLAGTAAVEITVNRRIATWPGSRCRRRPATRSRDRRPRSAATSPAAAHLAGPRRPPRRRHGRAQPPGAGGGGDARPLPQRGRPAAAVERHVRRRDLQGRSRRPER